jgi:hypothetical protein
MPYCGSHPGILINIKKKIKLFNIGSPGQTDKKIFTKCRFLNVDKNSRITTTIGHSLT